VSRQIESGTFVERKSSYKEGWKSADGLKGAFLVPKMPVVAMTGTGLELTFCHKFTPACKVSK
jgi:hypothetical protein